MNKLRFLFMLVPVFVFLIASCTSEQPDGEKPLSGIKMICVWTVVAENEEAVDQAVEQAADLGFNAVGWDRPGVVEACHRRGMKAFALLKPLDRRDDAQMQELMPGEEKLPGFVPESIPPDHYYQYGGEPLPGNREILDLNLACPNDPGVPGYALEHVSRVLETGFDGIVWDFIGYRNYHSCECPLCRAGLEEFRGQHPELEDEELRNAYYEKALVDLYDLLYRETKKIAPDMIIGNHIYPVFLPDIFYGLKLKLDYCSNTVAWFFKPFWPLDKVREYTEITLNGPYAHEQTAGMPMIGFYTDGRFARDRRSAERLSAEFEIFKQAGAQHLIMCELGHILRDPEAAEVVREALRN